MDAPRRLAGGRARRRLVRYDTEDLAPGVDGVVVLTVSRLAGDKRLPLLIEAFAQGTRLRQPASWSTAVTRASGRESTPPTRSLGSACAGVFLAGWRDDDEVPAFLSVADVLALGLRARAVRPGGGEAIACEVPGSLSIASARAEIVADGETGWLVEPDDVG